MSIKIKIIVIFGIILIIFLTSFIYNIFCLNRINKETKLFNIADRMVEDILQVRRYEKNFIIRGKAEWAEILKQRLTKLSDEVKAYRLTADNPADQDATEQIQRAIASYSKTFSGYVSTDLSKELRTESTDLIDKGRKIEQLCSQLSDKSVCRLNSFLNNIVRSQITVLIFSLLVAVITFFITSRTIIRPLKKLQKISREITEKGLGVTHINISKEKLVDIDFKDEIGELARTYIEMIMYCNNSYLSLQQKIKETDSLYKIKSEFTSIVSHELRTPLTAIKEGIDYVFDRSAGEINPEQKELLEIAKRNVDRLARLINDVLDFSKLTSHHVELKMELASINEIIESVIAIYRLVMEKKRLELVANLNNTKDLMLRLDVDRVSQVLSNLANNAIKFTDTGTVTISTDKDEQSNTLKVCVEDTGIGVKKGDIHRLFQPFTQLGDKKTRRPGGTGLGLAICKQIIDLLGGKIWAESEEGKGSKFCFVLPIKERRKTKVKT